MTLQVYQIDAWREPDGLWCYNECIPICTVKVKGIPSTRKILNSLYNKELLIKPNAIGKFMVDDYFDYEGTWVVLRRSNQCPVFELKELKEDASL